MKRSLLLYFLFLNTSFIAAFAQIQTADQIYSKINNAVVTIYTFDANGNPLAQGSGVVLNEKGWIVTNYHVYAGAEKLVVKHKNKIVEYTGIIGFDAEKDILILKTSSHSFPPISIGNSDLLKVGQKIYAIGSPMGFENTITDGIISGLRSNEQKTENFIQISAAISPGSSGGAVVNSKGQLIAITTLTVTKGQNLNFAIPINEVLAVYNKANKSNDFFGKVSNENSNLYLIKVGDKYGFINRLGKIVINPQYDDGRDFKEDIACVKLAGKWGIIDKSGKILIGFHLDKVTLFYEGLAIIKLNDRYGYINKYGQLLIEPVFFDAGDFSEGVAYVEGMDGYNKSYGFIDKTGKYIIKPQFVKASNFKEGLAAVFTAAHGYQFINKRGKLVIPAYQFFDLNDFNEDIAIVKYVDEKFKPTYGAVDKTGKLVIIPTFSYLFDFHEGMAITVGERKWGFIDKTGIVVIKRSFDFANDFSEGVADVKVGGKFGFINKAGQFVINPSYDFAAPFQNGLALVWIDKKWGYIDHLGDWIWKPQD